MRRLAQRVFGLLRTTPRKGQRKPLAKWRCRLGFEVLEDRLVPATAGFANTPPAVLSGQVFVDSHNTGVFQPGDLGIPGVVITLTGTGLTTPITTTTNASGVFTFFEVQAGTYTISRGAVNNMIDGRLFMGNLGGTLGNNVISNISVSPGQADVSLSFAVEGLVPAAVSLRDFLSISLLDQVPFAGPAGAGQSAVNGSVQPSTAAAKAGTSSLSGAVLDGSGVGMAGVQVSLSGTDINGLDLLQTATTNAGGNYSFSNLQAGTYALNVISQPAGFASGTPQVGTKGGLFDRNDQIFNINLDANASGTGYNFDEIAVPAPTNSNLGISAALADDTGAPANIGVTSDPSVVGRIASSSQITSFAAAMDSGASVSILGQLTGAGTFFLNPALMTQIAGGTLADGTHTLHLGAGNAGGLTTTFTVTFTLNTQAPPVPTLQLQGGTNGTTNNAAATLTGSLGAAGAGDTIVLFQAGVATPQTTTAAADGSYSFNVTLASGPTNFTVRAIDNARNTSQFKTFFVLEATSAISAVPTGNVAVSLPSGSTTPVDIDLSDPTLFKDTNLSNNDIVELQTAAGPLFLQLFGQTAPQTVQNFINYINSGAYTNDVFHRLDTNPPVLQGGGWDFSDTSNTPALTQVATNPTVPNEFDATNTDVAGTISMAKGSNPNSASSQFFFNLANNANTLGTANAGGFTVFGKVLAGTDQRVLNALAAFPVQSQTSSSVTGASAFNVFPIKNFTGTIPTGTTAANYDLIQSASVIQQTDQLTYTITTAPSGTVATASIVNNVTGGQPIDQLQITPVAAGTTTMTVQATDRAGNTASVTFSITVGAVSITNPGRQIVNDNQQVNLPLTVSPTSGVTFSATGLPPGLSINTSTGAITGTVAANADTNSPYVSTITATGSSTTSQTIGWTVLANPITQTAIGPQNNKDGDKVSLQVNASDSNGGTLTYSATGLPTGLSINPTTGLISGQISATANTSSPFTVNVEATDGTTNNTQTFQWTVTP